MTKLGIARMISVLTGAAVLFTLERGFGLQFYIALPLAIIAYLAVKVALGLFWSLDKQV